MGEVGFAGNRLCRNDHLEIIMMTLIITTTNINSSLNSVQGSVLSILFPCSYEGYSVGVPIFQMSEARHRVMKCLV